MRLGIVNTSLARGIHIVAEQSPAPTTSVSGSVRTPSRQRLRGLAGGWRRFRRSRPGLVGLAILTVYLAAAFAHPLLLATVWPSPVYDPVTGHDAPQVAVEVVEFVSDPSRQIDVVRAQLRHDPQAQLGDVLHVQRQPAPPNAAHLLGTDPRGRDVLSQLLFGARTALVLGIIAGISTVVIATVVASVAAFLGGFVNTVLMRGADLFVLLPAIPLLMFIAGLYELNLWTLGIVLGVAAGLGPTAVVLRAHAAGIVGQSFISAAVVSGLSRWRIIATHVVPNVAPLSMLYMMFTVASAIAAEAVLSWFGLLNVPMSWGVMLNIASAGGYIAHGFAYWWLLMPVGMAVSGLALAFYLIARGIEAAIDPQHLATEAKS